MNNERLQDIIARLVKEADDAVKDRRALIIVFNMEKLK